jgi:5-methylcytosine-specific restriction endonuclease McrA
MKIILLNLDNSPIRIITPKKALSLKRRQKVIPASEDFHIVNTIDNDIKIHKELKLIEFYPHFYKKYEKFSKKVVFIRDQYTCAYCGKKIKNKPTIDHIIPKSKGGKTNYLNVVTACEQCNFKKGNKNLKESGFNLFYKPKIPTKLEIIEKLIKK